MARVTLQVHHGGLWRDAATLVVRHPERGVASSCTLDYEIDYFAEQAAADNADGRTVADWRALSVRTPVDMEFRSFDRWPAFLLDLLPQGHARRRLAQKLGFPNPDAPETDLALLLAGGGSPIGNLRVMEAWRNERREVERTVEEDGPCPGVTTDDILERSDTFLDVAGRFALAASGSSGVQGEWPKILMTQAGDGLWYPDSIVPDEDARRHVIVKMSRAKGPEDAVILAGEAPYLEVAREFGLDVGAPLIHGSHVLMIPRFDRVVGADGGVVRLGQESLVAALGVSEFGYAGRHEEYLGVITRHSSDPAADVIEYVLRDLLNVAMGNPDNHGRNSALRKLPDGAIRLSPLFDFAPMRLDPGVIRRATRWGCMGGRDSDPDWTVICRAAAGDVLPADKLMAALASRAGFLRRLPEIARKHGVPEEAVSVALRRHGDMADRVAALTNGGVHG